MPRKQVRGRFSIVVPLDGGGLWRCDSVAEKSIGPSQMVESLRKYADFIEKYFVQGEQPHRAAKLDSAKSDVKAHTSI